MNNNLQTNGNNPFEIFNYNNLGSVRTTVDQYGNPWFCLLDVCNILGISNNRNVVYRLPDDVHTTDVIIDELGRTQNATFINESGLYQAIGNSRKPEAKNFMKWIFGEVIPSIRRNGYYTMLQNPTFNLNGKDYKPNLTGFIHWVGDTLENHENRIGICENTLTSHTNQLQDHRAITDDLSSSIGTMLHHSAVTIAGFINLYKLPINPSSENLRNLGLQAKQLTESRGFTVGSIYDERWGKVNVYPVDILQELFSTIS